ncbi:hypothetical protein PUN28_017796 [Cardiocondyla obscurior]|uniref:Uncharacterized protein n=1 Tax=Cardiocondyla obscurior TaxID=286306 RepID=A0AAW2EMX7_9HYME
MLSNRHVLKNASICKNVYIKRGCEMKIYLVVKHHKEIHIKGYINIKKKYSIKNERYRDRQYNIYIWMGPHEGGDVFGLRRLFDMEEDIAFAPESWS